MAATDLQQDVDLVSAIQVIPRILEVVCRSTGMGFAAIARVTETRWVCCSVRDEIGFGLQPGGELEVQTTICDEIRASGQAVVIDNAAEDPVFCGHPTPAKYGFQSYISVPIRWRDGSFFGTLCAIDPRPARLKTPEILGMFELFSQLIAFHMDSEDRLRASESALLDAGKTAQLREQFIAVLGHDLRNPLQALKVAAAVVERAPERGPSMVPVMKQSLARMSELVDNLMDFARGRLGGGLPLSARVEQNLEGELRHLVEEVTSAWPGRTVAFEADLQAPVRCDRLRLTQLLANLLVNALKYGTAGEPVQVQVQARSTPEQFELRVTNAGPPIPEDVRRRLFEPYYRAANASSTEGLGLGLYIVAEIARAHGGTIDVASADGRVTFSFRMPQAVTA
jgi:signal transduction histidine kinase